MHKDQNVQPVEKSAPKSPLLVVAAIVLKKTSSERRVLIARRRHDSSLEAGKWEFPGGKVEMLEHPEQTVAREVREELGLEIKVQRIFDVASHVYATPKGPVHIVLLCYLCQLANEQNDQFELLEVSEAKWVRPSELNDFDYAAADVETVELLKRFLATN